MTSSQAPDVASLFASAHNDDAIGADALAILNVTDLSAKINDAMGTPADAFQQSEIILLSVLIDDSGSIRFAGNSQHVRDGHNLLMEAMAGCKQQDNILFSTRLLNQASGVPLNPYRALSASDKLTDTNYNPNGGTPLYDQGVVFLGSTLAKTQEFSDAGVPARSISVFVTDGADMHSLVHTAAHVKTLADDMQRQENHIVAFMGIEDPSSPTDFRAIAQEMGVRPEWILTPDNTPSDIRKAFQTLSQSAVRASQSAASFSQQAVGGFGAP